MSMALKPETPSADDGEMPIVLDPEFLGCCGGKKDDGKRVSGSDDHTRKFVDAVLSGTRANCDIETSVRSDALCQLAAIAVKAGLTKAQWDATCALHPTAAEEFVTLRTAVVA